MAKTPSKKSAKVAKAAGAEGEKKKRRRRRAETYRCVHTRARDRGVLGVLGPRSEVARERGRRPALTDRRSLSPVRRCRSPAECARSFYIHKVLRQVRPGTTISSKGMAVMDSFMKDIFDKVRKRSRPMSSTLARVRACRALRVASSALCRRACKGMQASEFLVSQAPRCTHASVRERSCGAVTTVARALTASRSSSSSPTATTAATCSHASRS